MFSPNFQANAILGRLPAEQAAAIHAAGRLVALDPGKVLHSFGQPTTSVYFPIDGVVSLTIPVNGDQNVEVALVGPAGIVGIGALMGNQRSDLNAMAQIRGSAWEIGVADLTPAMREALNGFVTHYAASLMIEIAQTAGCNRLHSVEQRTARWLLQAAHHAQRDEIELTHEFLAMMLAVRRASVTVVVGVFNRAGLLVAERGRISVGDRKGLLEVACECYEVIEAAAPVYN